VINVVDLTPDLHEIHYQESIKKCVEDALQEMGLRNYRIKWDPRDNNNRGDLFILNPSRREILVIEVKKTKSDVSSPRYWDQARRYVLNSRNWNPTSPKIFCITNGELLISFCYRSDFTHIEYCLLKNGRVPIGDFGVDGRDTDQVLIRFKNEIKTILKICIGLSPLEFDNNWYPILERFRVELDSIKTDVLHAIELKNSTDCQFVSDFQTYYQVKFPRYGYDDVKGSVATQIAESLMFKALCYEVIRFLLRDVDISQIHNVRLRNLPHIFNEDHTVDTLAELYTEIMRIDYRSVFKPDEISDRLDLTEAGQESLVSFIQALRSIHDARDEISDPDFLIGSVVNHLIPLEERHFTGLTLEDRHMIDRLVHLCVQQSNNTIIDIAAGTCAILEGAYDKLNQLKIQEGSHNNHRAILSQLTAIEANQFYAKLGALRLIFKNIQDEMNANILIQDAFTIQPNADFDIVLCNPPYLRQAAIPTPNKEFMRQRIVEEYQRQRIDGNFPYSEGQADKYFYFFEWSLLFLKDGGIAGFIISDKFLNGESGQQLKRLLLDHTDIISIIKYPGRFFEGFTVTTCFLIARRKLRRSVRHSVNFIRVFDEITPDQLKAYFDSVEELNTTEVHIERIAQSELSPEDKWGKYLIRIPDSYTQCLNHQSMRPIKEVFNNRVKRGKDNGCNAFFFPVSTGFKKGKKEPDEDFQYRKRHYKDHIHQLIENIEPEFIRPAINNSDLPRGYYIDEHTLIEEPLLVIPHNMNMDEYPGVSEFIQFGSLTYVDSEEKIRSLLDGSSLRIEDRPTICNRHIWYSLYSDGDVEDDYALIIPRAYRSRFKILIPETRAFFSTNFVGFGRFNGMRDQDLKFILGFLMSSFGQLQFEIEGTQREGVLKIEAGQMYKLRIPDPNRVSQDKKDAVTRELDLLPFGVTGLELSGETNSRFNLDAAVMRLYYPVEDCESKAIEVEEVLSEIVTNRDPNNENR
jgi:methylase of polypeptide subunit release factors